MVGNAVESKAQADLESLVRAIAKQQADPKPHKVRELHKRYLAVENAAKEHQAMLGTRLDAAEATLTLVQAQMASLWAAVGERIADET